MKCVSKMYFLLADHKLPPSGENKNGSEGDGVLLSLKKEKSREGSL
jgi:hypothetical protein